MITRAIYHTCTQNLLCAHLSVRYRTVILSYHIDRQNSNKKGDIYMSPFLSYSPGVLLFSRDSTSRTYGFARTAIDASVSDNVLRFAFFDSTSRASACAGTAFYAFVRNYMHVFHLQTHVVRGTSPLFFLIIARIVENVNDPASGKKSIFSHVPNHSPSDIQAQSAFSLLGCPKCSKLPAAAQNEYRSLSA